LVKPDLSAEGVGSLLSTLRTLPVWMLAGLAIAGYAVLFVPAFGGIDPAGFRPHWGIWIWIEAVTFSILALTRALDAGVTAYHVHRKTAEASRALRLVPLHHQCWWHLAKQQDDSFVSEIRMDIDAANLTDHPVRIVKARLIRPKPSSEVLHADISLPAAGSPYHSSKHGVPAHGTVTAALNMMVRGTLARQGSPIRATLGIIDQFGDEYRLKKVVIRTRDRRPPKQSWRLRLISNVKRLPGLRSKPEATAPLLPQEWHHEEAFEEVDLILNEEKRAYAARGRIMGGLGSLNIGLQSEPNLGWTKAGDVPSLLWNKEQGKPVGSPNITRIMELREGLDDASKDNLERYLLSHLHKGSPFADVAYFIFLALHRMGKTVEALQAARARLTGDKVFGYSNLLGTLSAVISHEHFQIDPSLFPRIQQALEGDTEHSFRLIEKINLARLEHLDSELTEQESKPRIERNE
jgi:hypothetical protein